MTTRTLPESAHGLTLDQWCARFEKPFMASNVAIRSRVPSVVDRDPKLARRKGLPVSEELLTYSFTHDHALGCSSMSSEVSLYWEDGWEPERFAAQIIRRMGGKAV